MPQLDLFLRSLTTESFRIDREAGYVDRIVKLGQRVHRTRLPLPSQGPFQAISGDEGAVFDLAWLGGRKPPEVPKAGACLVAADLFSGCGGLSLGIGEACRSAGFGFRSAFACDTEQSALDVFVANLSPSSAMSEPVETWLDREFGKPLSAAEQSVASRVGDVDFLVGGPPCQGHSDLNNHTRRNDPRNNLYGVMARAAEILRPTYVLIENVPGVRHATSRVVQRTSSQIASLGYSLVSLVLNAADYGVAQERKRHFTVGTLGETDGIIPFIETLKRPRRPVLWAIGDLLDEADRGGTTYATAATHSAENARRISYLFENDLFELPDAERPDCHRLKPHSYKSVYGRMRPDRPAPTITGGFGSTGQGRFVHPLRRRTLTPHEAARVQFFPDWFSFGDSGRRDLQKLIGNAVPTKLGYVLGLALLNSTSST